MTNRRRISWVLALGLPVLLVSEASAQDKVGIPVCDAFLAKYDACIASIERPERRARLQETAAQLRTTWIAAAADKSGSANLEQLCLKVAEGTKQNATMSKCQW
jgi:hypothetical protein